MAGTHINIAAVKAEMRMHEEALIHAQKALNLLKRNFSPTPNMVIGLIIAYHNVGLQFEHLGDEEEATKHYQSGMELALEQLGRHHPLTIELAKAHKNAIEGDPVSPKIEVPLPLVLERPRFKPTERRYFSRNLMAPVTHKRNQFKSVSPRESDEVRAAKKSVSPRESEEIYNVRASKKIKNSWS